jgi:hypothetical protein
VKTFPKKTIILIRDKDWKQYQWMLAAMIRKSLAKKSGAELEAAEGKLRAFEKEKKRKTLENLLLHELGHGIGLGHNFAVPSVMNYTDETAPTDYDEKSLSCRLNNVCDADYPLSLQAGKADPGGRD